MRKFLIPIFISLAILCSTLSVTFAQTQAPPINPLQGDDSNQIYLPGANTPANQGDYIQNKFLPKVTSMIIALTGGLSLLFVIVSGIQILTAFEKEEQLAEAKKTLTWALIGFIISILSYAIVQIVVSINFTST